MFGNYKREIKDLKSDINELRGKILCLQGLHDWGLMSNPSSATPYIWCNRCYTAHPQQPMKGSVNVD